MSEKFVVKVGRHYLKVTDTRRRLSNLVSKREDATDFFDRDDAVVWKDHEERERAIDETPTRVRIAKIVRRAKAVWMCVCVHPPDNHGLEGCVVETCPCLITRAEGTHRPFRGSGATTVPKVNEILTEFLKATQEEARAATDPSVGDPHGWKLRGYTGGLEFALKMLGIRS